MTTAPSALFVLSPEVSRYNSAFSLMKLLEDTGIRSAILGFTNMEDYCVKKGRVHHSVQSLSSPAEIFRQILTGKFGRASYSLDQVGQELYKQIKTSRATWVFLSSTMVFALPYILETGARIYLLHHDRIPIYVFPDAHLCCKRFHGLGRIRALKTYVARKYLNPFYLLSRAFGPHKNLCRRLRRLNVNTRPGLFLPDPQLPRVILSPKFARLEYGHSIVECEAFYLGISIDPAPPKLEANFAKRRDKLILFSLGTLVNERTLGGFWKLLVDATIRWCDERGDCALIISMGRYGCLEHIVIPNEADWIQIVDNMPQYELLGQADLIICHGGWSTVMESLDQCCPMLVAPFFYDQPCNAEFVESRGFGRAIYNYDFSFGKFKAHCEEILHDSRFRDRLRRARENARESEISALLCHMRKRDGESLERCDRTDRNC